MSSCLEERYRPKKTYTLPAVSTFNPSGTPLKERRNQPLDQAQIVGFGEVYLRIRVSKKLPVSKSHGSSIRGLNVKDVAGKRRRVCQSRRSFFDTR